MVLALGLIETKGTGRPRRGERRDVQGGQRDPRADDARSAAAT